MPTNPQDARLVILMYNADYRGAYERIRSGAGETYFGQRNSVEAVASLGQRIKEVTTITLLTEERYDTVLEPGVRAIGLGHQGKTPTSDIVRQVMRLKPTHIFCRTLAGHLGVLSYVMATRTNTMVSIANIVPQGSLKSRIKNRVLTQLLNQRSIRWLAIYGRNLCEQYTRMGVNPEKVIPFHFSGKDHGPMPSKQLDVTKEAFEIFFVGSMIEGKGIGDLITAVADLKNRGVPIRLRAAGDDKSGRYHRLAEELGVTDCIDFMGLVANETLVPAMHAADVVVVPSRHEYFEGFPLAITHALEARTPVVVSDEPMFLQNLEPERSALVFPAGDSSSLADTIERLLGDPDLYKTLSNSSAKTLKRLDVPVKFEELLERWLFESEQNTEWLYRHRYAAEFIEPSRRPALV